MPPRDILVTSRHLLGMEYTKLGNTGLDVSRIRFGCMTYGVPERGTHPWTLDEAATRPFIERAPELGAPKPHHLENAVRGCPGGIRVRGVQPA